MLVCCRSLILNDFSRRFAIDLGAQKNTQKAPKRSPKPTTIEAKIQHEQLSLWGASWTSLGPFWGRYRTHLGLTNHKNSSVFKGVREHHVFEEDKA